MKNINLEDYYTNEIKNDNSNNDSESIKNIKFLSLQKEKKDDKSFDKMKMHNNDKLFNNKHNTRKIYYSYGNKKNIKEILGSRTINN